MKKDNRDSYTWQELVDLGCPAGLIMQYIWFTKAELKKYFNIGQLDD